MAALILVAGVASNVAHAVEPTDISGTVIGPKGPEAGVWVIAETTELPTRFARIVVTDDKGRYLIPDLPNVDYSVWVRGYGLVDSPKIRATPGRTLDLTAIAAPNEAAAAHYYPAIHWYSMLKLPRAEDFGGKTYVLEVSSPGIERPLRNARDWQRFVGRTAVVTANVPGDPAGRRTDEIEIAGVEGDAGQEIVIVRDDRGVERRFPLSAVEKARLAFHWKR